MEGHCLGTTFCAVAAQQEVTKPYSGNVFIGHRAIAPGFKPQIAMSEGLIARFIGLTMCTEVAVK